MRVSVCVCVCVCARACVCMLCATDKTQGEEPACRHILATAVIARRSCAWALRHLLPHRKPMLQLTTPRTHTHTHARMPTRKHTHTATASPYSVNILLDYTSPSTQTHTCTHTHIHVELHQVNYLRQRAVFTVHILISWVYVLCVCVGVCVHVWDE